MWRGYGKREFAAWTAIICLVAFGTGAVLVKRFRPVGPMEFRELPTSAQVTSRAESAPPPVVVASAPPQVQPSRTSIATTPVQPDATSNSAPPEVAPATTPRRRTKADPEAGSISLNVGQLADFEALPGVGPAIAQRIIDYRADHGPFQSIDEVRNVKGIGEKRFSRIEPYLKL
ncbi:MAG: ComEA family DNA-binding protein [Fimbriimonadaceae bacterium]